MAVKAVALMVLAIGLAAPAYADSTDDAFIANLSTSGMNYGAPERAIQVAKTVVCGTLSNNPNTSNADLTTKVTNATNWPPLNAAYFTGAAIQAYCPQYGSLAPPIVPSTAPSLPPKPAVQPALTRNAEPQSPQVSTAEVGAGGEPVAQLVHRSDLADQKVGMRLQED